MDEEAGLLAVRAREATGLTQEDFAALIGCDRVTVANWETGRRPPSRLSASLLRLIAAHPKLAVKTLRQGQEDLQKKLDALHERVARTRRSAESVADLTDSEVAEGHERRRKAGKKKKKKKGGRK